LFSCDIVQILLLLLCSENATSEPAIGQLAIGQKTEGEIMIDRIAPSRPKILSYPGLRKSGGYLGIALPFVLVFGQILLQHYPAIQDSISAYYHTDLRNILVGDLCAIAVFLIACKGYDQVDAILGDFAGLCAVGVAFFPTNCEECPKTLISKLHATFASLLFLQLAVFCLVLFTKTVPDKTPTPEKLTRNNVYKVCGYVIIVCIVLSLVTSIPSVRPLLGWKNYLFFYESIAVIVFGVAWITKGGTILRDKGEPPMPLVTTDMSADLGHP
jgi:Protein of unknown function (DUF998)